MKWSLLTNNLRSALPPVLKANKKWLLLIISVGLLASVTASLLSPKTSYADSDIGNNDLLLIGQHCHDLNGITHDFGTGGNASRCHIDKSADDTDPNGGWEEVLQDHLGCSGNMYYQHDFTDPHDPSSVVKTLWYTHQGTYKDCYNKALAMYNTMSDPSGPCGITKDGSSNNDDCNKDQDNLHEALGCDGNMFQRATGDGKPNSSGNYWIIKPLASSDCKNRISAVGNIHIKVIGPDGQPIDSPDAISSDAVAATLDGGGGGGGGGGEIGASCPLDGSPLSWIICPVMDLFQTLISKLDNFITSQLSVGTPANSDDPNVIFCDSASTNKQVCGAYHSAWASFRNIALGLVVIAALIIVISEMSGLEFFDAYTMRKVLPRLVIATLAIVLSWQLLQFFVTLTNDLGYGVRFLIQKPFITAGIDQARLSGGGADLASAGLIGAATFLAIAGLFSFLATGALAVFIAFMVLMIRQVVIIMLILIAPIAIVLYILPNTNNMFRLWWDSFAKALLMFPMIVGLITAGRVFAAVSTAEGGNAISQVVGFAAYFAPYFMIPLTFRFAGGIMSGVGNAVNQRGEGGRQFLKKFRSSQAQKKAADLAAGTRLHEDVGPKAYRQFAQRFNRATAGAANLSNAGYNPYHMKDRMAAARSSRQYDQYMKAIAEDPDLRYALSNDDIAESLIPGVESYQGSGHLGGGDDKARRQFLQDRGYTQESGLEEMVAAGRTVSRKLPTQAVGLAAWTANWSTGTGFSEKNVDFIDADGNKQTRKTGGSGEAFMALADMTKGSNGGDQLRANAIAKAREGATQQRRSDFYGMSFTEQMLLARDVAGPGYGAVPGQSRQQVADGITERVRKGATWGKSRGEHITGRPQAIKAIVPQLEANFDQILTNTQGDGTRQEFMQELGMAAAGQQAAGQASPENAKEHAKYMNHEIILTPPPADPAKRVKGAFYAAEAPHMNREVQDALVQAAAVKTKSTGKQVTAVTVQDLVDVNRNDRELTALVYQYGNQFAADAAAAAAAAAQSGGAVPPPIPPPGGGGGGGNP